MFATLSRAAYVRIIPFLLFMALLALRGNLPADTGIDLRWLYGLSTLLVGGLLLYECGYRILYNLRPRIWAVGAPL